MSRTRAPVVILPYDARWPALAEQLAGELLDACGDAIRGVEHIGSTAVPGCAAKPIIDLMPALASFEAGADCVAPLEARGYAYLGEYGLPRRHFFVRYAEDSTVGLTEHVHMYTPGEGQWDDQLAFRDYLRTHEEARDEYSALKRELAARFGRDRDGYTEAKTDFVRRIHRLAREQRAGPEGRGGSAEA